MEHLLSNPRYMNDFRLVIFSISLQTWSPPPLLTSSLSATLVVVPQLAPDLCSDYLTLELKWIV
jgi:hypothetical protein